MKCRAFGLTWFLGLATLMAGPVEPRDMPHPAAVPALPGPYELQICYELAVLRSETLGMREEDIRVAEARYWQSIAAVLPKAHAIVSEDLRNPGSTGGGNFGNSGNSFSGGRSDFFSSRINVKQPLFSGFREFNVGAAARSEIEAGKQRKTRALHLLYLDVADVFYQVLMYEGDLKLWGEIVSSLQQRVEELDKRVQLGKSRKGERLMAQADLADARATLAQVKGLLGASQELMSFLTGLQKDQISLREGTPIPQPEELERYLAVTGERPDILAAIQEEHASRRQVSAAKGEHWPTISAEGNYYLKQDPNSGRDWDVFLTFDLPLFEGGAIEARVSEKKAQQRSSKLSLDQLRRTADRDVRTAYNNFISAMAQFVQLREASAVAADNYQVQKDDYLHGVVSNLDVLSSLRQWYDLRRRLVDAEMNARLNLVRLHVEAGKVATP